MPAEGTEAHVTLLVAEFLCERMQSHQNGPFADQRVRRCCFIARAKDRYGRYWRKSAREPGAEHELAMLRWSDCKN